jgi:hypothetical protein
MGTVASSLTASGKYKNKSFDLNDMNPNIQILQENEHTHEEDDDMIGKNEALYQMKDAVREDAPVQGRMTFYFLTNITVYNNSFPIKSAFLPPFRIGKLNLSELCSDNMHFKLIDMKTKDM